MALRLEEGPFGRVEVEDGKEVKARDFTEGSMPRTNSSGQPQSAAMPKGRTTAQVGLRKMKWKGVLKHLKRAPRNYGIDLRDVCLEETQKVSGRRWTELSMASDGGGTLVEATKGNRIRCHFGIMTQKENIPLCFQREKAKMMEKGLALALGFLEEPYSGVSPRVYLCLGSKMSP